MSVLQSFCVARKSVGSLKVQHKSVLVDGQFSSLSAAKEGSVQRTLRNRNAAAAVR